MLKVHYTPTISAYDIMKTKQIPTVCGRKLIPYEGKVPPSWCHSKTNFLEIEKQQRCKSCEKALVNMFVLGQGFNNQNKEE